MSGRADTLEGFAQLLRGYTGETQARGYQVVTATFEFQVVLAEDVLASSQRVERQLATTITALNFTKACHDGLRGVGPWSA